MLGYNNISTSTGTFTCYLDSVIYYSICPANATCINAGTAAARFYFTKNNKREIVTLSFKPTATFSNQYPSYSIVLGYKISFTALTPYPGLATYNYADYKAEITIEEKTA